MFLQTFEEGDAKGTSPPVQDVAIADVFLSSKHLSGTLGKNKITDTSPLVLAGCGLWVCTDLFINKFSVSFFLFFK